MFDQVIAVNVKGVFLGLKAIMPELDKRGGGSIVITSSTAGIRAVGGMSAYVIKACGHRTDAHSCHGRRAYGYPRQHRKPIARRHSDDVVY